MPRTEMRDTLAQLLRLHAGGKRRMIKDILQQLAPLDAKIAALRASGRDMTDITNHAPNWQSFRRKRTLSCPAAGADRRGPGLSGPSPGAPPHRREIVAALFTDFFEQRGDRQCKEDAAILGGVARSTGCR